MVEPSASAHKCASIPKMDNPVLVELLCHSLCEALSSEKIGVAHGGCRCRESISDNIDLRRSGLQLFLAAFICREQLADLADFPARLDLNAELIAAVRDNRVNCLFEIAFGRAKVSGLAGFTLTPMSFSYAAIISDSSAATSVERN